MDANNKVSHLNMIQQIIARMGNNSFSLKGWTVGIMIAIYAFAGSNSHKAVVVTLIPLFCFWLLDTYYLMLERKFRLLFDDVRNKNEKEIDFDMNINNLSVNIQQLKKYGFFNIMFSKTVFPFYLVCTITTLIVYFVKF